jgi:Tfp pilus assembly pilus retraction ATPase PilT
MLRLHKHLLPVGTETMSGGAIEALMYPIMNDDQKAVFKQHLNFDFSYSIKGLVVATEVLTATPAVRNLICENKSYQIVSTMQTSGAMGMMTMEKCVKELVARGIVAADVALRAGVNVKDYI